MKGKISAQMRTRQMVLVVQTTTWSGEELYKNSLIVYEGFPSEGKYTKRCTSQIQGNTGEYEHMGNISIQGI